MWKYKCRMQFISLLAGFFGGMALGAFLYFTSSMSAQSLVAGISIPDPALVTQMTEFLNSHMLLIYMLGYGLFIGGLINVIILAQFLINEFHVNMMIVFFMYLVLDRLVFLAGLLMYLPMLIITLYGWMSLRNQDRMLLKSRHLSNDAEIIRIYEIHHPLVESVKDLAVDCAKNIRKVTYIYILGTVAIFAFVFAIRNFLVVMTAVILYLFSLNYLLRYRASCIMPITSLLYNDCNPSACASAIIYYSKARSRTNRLQLQSLFAQCCIYMDDPALAEDALITYPRKDATSTLNYWSLMSYIDYLLKDEDGLYRCKEEASRVNLRFGKTGVVIKNEELAAIENRINLMNSDFNECKKYFLNIYNHAALAFEKVDAAYYIALISYVQREYPLAKIYFEKVVQKGSTMYFKAKAQKYLETLGHMQLDESV